MRTLGLVLSVVAAVGCGDGGDECAAPSVDQGVVGHGHIFIAEDEGSREPYTGRVVRAYEGGVDSEGVPLGELVQSSAPTDDCGLFQLALAPGTYSLCVQGCSGECLQVTVGTGAIEHDFTLDINDCYWE